MRRDDLWGKALVSADGDHQKAKGKYIELLAGHLEREARAPAYIEQRRKLGILLKRWSVGLVAIGGVVLLLGILCSNLYESYRQDWIANVAVRDYPQPTTPARVLVDVNGQQFPAPSFQQYYEVAAGVNVNSFTEVQRDLAQLRPLLIYMKYGEDIGGILVRGLSDALRVHSLASLSPPSFLEMIQDAMGLGVKSSR